MKGASVVLLILVSDVVSAQLMEKKYFTRDNKPTDAEHSYYYETGKRVLMQRNETIGWIDTVYVDTVKTFYASTNSLRSRRFYREGYAEGPYNVYHSNGRLKEKGFYKKGQKTGYAIHWTESGTVKQTLQYFYQETIPLTDSFKIVNYWADGRELVKDGFGFYDGDLFDTGLFEKGRVVGGFRDSVWHINSGDSVLSREWYEKGQFVRGESTYKGDLIKYDDIVEQAVFPGEIKGMMRFLQKNLKYPPEARQAGMQDRVFVKFVVNAQGKISAIRVIKGRYESLNKEAVRIVKSSPRWIPGKLRGTPVKSDFILPISFKIEL
jgi:TonB family protein